MDFDDGARKEIRETKIFFFLFFRLNRAQSIREQITSTEKTELEWNINLEHVQNELSRARADQNQARLDSFTDLTMQLGQRNHSIDAKFSVSLAWIWSGAYPNAVCESSMKPFQC